MLKIGPYTLKNEYILAPMAGVSQMPFRVMALKMGAGAAPTELISAKGLMYESLRSLTYLTYDKAIEKPFWVQLFGGESEAMAQGAKIAMEKGAQIIDINMGCPVKKVTKTMSGSALLCDLDRAKNIIKAIKNKVGSDFPITAKIRSGWDFDSLNFIEVGRVLEDAGISLITLHARTRSQGYSGKANLEHIKLLKKALSIPVIGNGDILNLEQAQKVKEETLCDGVMIGRAALGNPWVFSNVKNISKLERFNIIKEHLQEHIEFNTKLKTDSIKSFRSHIIWYSKGLQNGALFRTKVIEIVKKDELYKLMENFFLESDIEKGDNEEIGVDYNQAFG